MDQVYSANNKIQIYVTLTCTTSLGLSWPGSNSYEGVLHTPKNLSLIIYSLMSYPGHLSPVG